MQLSLSSAAAPDATLPELLASCKRRGLVALELEIGHGHKVHERLSPVDRANIVEMVRQSGVSICGIRFSELGTIELGAAARLSAELEAPLIVPADELAPDLRGECRMAFAAAGARLLVEHGTEPMDVAELRSEIARTGSEDIFGLAWSVHPGDDDPRLVAGVLANAGALHRYVTLHGGGPESAQQTGMGVGALMARLALARYEGPLVLTPSTPKYRVAWNAWLGRAGGWGCGSKQSDSSLVTL